MKLIITLLISLNVLITLEAIKVPTSWTTSSPNKHHRPSYGTVFKQGSEIGYQSKPYGTITNKKKQSNQFYFNNNHRFNRHQLQPNNKIKILPPISPQLVNVNELNHQNNWIPMVPVQASPIGYQRTVPNFYHTPIVLQTFAPPVPVPPVQVNEFRNSPIFRNYRDDKSHEPADFDSRDVTQPLPKFERNEDEKAPISDHETEFDVPTRPIYPGEGQWAKRGKKFQLFNNPHKFSQLTDNSDGEEPEGYEIFRQNEKLVFDKHKEKFHHKFPLSNHQSAENERENDESEVEESDNDEFTPVRLYTQVRRSEAEKHLPREAAEDPRLREVVKDSKIQTVYTEEGYEDSAYDHAGHEKNAEEDEGESEFEDDEENKKLAEDSATAGSEYKVLNKPKAPKRKKTNNFITTKETKLTAVKDKGNGTTEMEISSEIKVLMTPNNSTKAHKFVKIYPKVYRYDEAVNEVEETTTTATTTTTTASGTVALIDPPIIQQSDAVVVEIPSSTIQTTTPVVSVNELDVMESIRLAVNQPINKIRPKNRFKRYTNDFPKIEVDTDFIDKIKHDLPTVQKLDLTAVKYPYYNLNPKQANLNPNSPLRYSEALDNIPEKHGGDLAFYDQAGRRTVCQEVESDVDPIPERIKNADEDNDGNGEENSKVQETIDGPRLRNLGDKIDCFKVKYFGANPLDSPIFKEEIVGPVENIFNVNSPNRNENAKLRLKKPDDDAEEFVLPETTVATNNYVTKKSVHPDVEIINIDKIQAQTVENRVEVPVVSIITTPKYTIDLTPRNIYDQIQLLQYLPTAGAPEGDKIEYRTTTETPTTRQTTRRTTTTTTTRRPITTTTRRPTTTTIRTTTTTTTPKPVKIIEENQNERQPRIMTGPKSAEEEEEYNDDENVEELDPSSELNEDSPESQALVKKRQRMRMKRPQFHIFDINKFLPKNPFSQLTHQHILGTASNHVPNYKPLSEVHYKNEIQPNEQLNVFADVINNIKNSSNDPLQTSASTQSSNQIAVKLNTFGRVKLPPRSIHIKNPNSLLRNIEKMNSFYLTTSTTTTSTTTPQPQVISHRSRVKKRKNQYNPEGFYEDLLINQQISEDIPPYDNIELMKINKRTKPTIKTTTSASTTSTTTTHHMQSYVDSISAPSELEDDDDADYANTATVIGLEPPKPPSNYQIVHNNSKKKSNIKRYPQQTSASMYEVIDEVPMNNFYVQGMKPPSPKQKVMLYSDYKLYGNNMNGKFGLHHHNHHRTKRNTKNKRQNYSQLNRNRNKPIDDDGDDEETVEKEAAEEVKDDDADDETVADDDDDDDYVPHRPKNYYYDEKTGKIVYNNKNKDDEDEETEEITEKTLPKPTKRLSTTTKSSYHREDDSMSEPSFIDFIMKLKSSLSYHEIPDPTTTKKPEVAAVPVTAKLVQTTTKPTKPPEFLNILAKVRSDSSYQAIEDKKKTTTTTTTSTTTTEPGNIVMAEESQVENVQNSPGTQTNPELTYHIFDINEYLPKIKNYIPKTSIDISKYKTIERPSVALRHNLSSRYNSDEEISLEDVNTNRVPILLRKRGRTPHEEDEDEEQRGEIVEEDEESSAIRTTTVVAARTTSPSIATTRRPPTTTTQPPATTTAKRVRLRVRTRGTTTTTEQPSAYTTTEHQLLATNDKPRRTYPRRRPGRIKINPTTSTTTEGYFNDPELENPAKIVNRRHQPQSRTIKDNVAVNDETRNKPIIVVEERSDEEQPNRPQPRKLDDVQVFNKFDETKKHGGNYRREEEEEEEGDEEGNVKRPSDVYIFQKVNQTNKHGGNYRGDDGNEDPSNTEVIESRKISQVEVYKTFDETEDGDDNPGKNNNNNNKRENEDLSNEENKPKNTQIESRKVVQVFNEYDQTKREGDYDDDNEEEVVEETPTNRHGGNYKRKEEIPKQVEVINKNYDQTRRHGGNYRRIEDSPERVEIAIVTPIGNNNKSLKIEEAGTIQPQNIEIFKLYDKTKKHGGNYIRQEETKARQQPIIGNRNVEIFNQQYDKTQKHGGNYRKQEGGNNEEEVKRLTDIVPKPYSFYSDPNLPMHVNQLKEIGLIQPAGDDNNQTHDDDYDADEVKINFSNNSNKSEEKLLKKAIFVKDPSKRLYYYARV